MIIKSSNTPTEDIAEAIATSILEYDGHTICLTAGGSALAIFNYLNDPEVKRRTIFMMGDERASGDIEESNFIQLQKILGEQADEYQLVDTQHLVNESLEKYADRLSQKISDLKTVQENAQIICILGVGSDGHTAGIFPLTEDLFLDTYEADQTYVPVKLEGLKIDSRASVTPQWILNNVDHIFVYAAGEAKKNILGDVICNDKKIFELPAQLINEHANATLFTDNTF